MSTEVEEADLPPGSQLGPYVIERCVGIGGMGEVYEARHTGLNKRVAVKALRRDVARKPVERARFLREGEMASQLSHPNIVDITDVGELDGIPYFVMEFLDGEDLSDLLRREAPLETERLVDLILPVVAAVGHAHENRIIHRDIKPGNILLSKTSSNQIVPKILDFGISKNMDGDDKGDLTQTSSLLGTPHYMAPEQARGAKYVDERADQYAVGAILYQGVTGLRPHESEGVPFLELMNSIATGDVTPPSSRAPGVSSEIEAIILKAMHRERGSRYPTMRELGQALLPYASDRGRTLYEPAIAALTRSIAEDETVHERQAIARTNRDDLTTLGRGANTLGGARSQASARSKWMLRAVLAVALAMGAVVMAKQLDSTEDDVGSASAAAEIPSKPSRYSVVLAVVPSDAVIELDGRRVGLGRLERDLELNGEIHRLRVSREGYQTQILTFRDAPPPKRVSLLEVPEVSAKVPEPDEGGGPPVKADESAVEPRPARPGAGSTPPPAPSEETPAPARPSTDNIDPWAQ